jgi:hypothetical protein
MGGAYLQEPNFKSFIKPMTDLGTKIFISSTENDNWAIIKTSLNQKKKS